jgi:hypothetical protein
MYLFSVKTFVFFFFLCSSFDKREGLVFFHNCCSLTTPYSTRGHIKVRYELLAPMVSRITPLHGPHIK